ncbi:MAG: MBL fold metallo-hydrolase [Thioalkalispiraceae bacterium]|jgi:glyoxylase-like metal-dependent hydrolase (beta-lactamase superfamily II)
MAYWKLTLVGVIALIFNQQASAEILPAPKQISAHVYAWIGPYPGPSVENKGYRMNLVFVVGKEAIAVLDSGYYPKMAQEMVQHIRRVSEAPIKYVINTNSQPHRMLGNDVFRQLGADIITTQPEADRMQSNANNYAMMLENIMKFKPEEVVLPKPPNRIIAKPLSLDLGGGVKIKLDMYKAAHTPLPLIVSIPGDNVVYTGDILYSGRLLSLISGSDMRQWIETYDYLKKYGDAMFIPGHGHPAKLAAFEHSTRAYLVMLNTHMTKMVEEGVDMQDAINKLDQSAYKDYANYDFLAGRNANIAYQEAERASFE